MEETRSAAQAAGTDGDPVVARAAEYVSRLTGAAINADAPLTLRSIHRAALVSWARRENTALSFPDVRNGAPFSLRDILGTSPPNKTRLAEATGSDDDMFVGNSGEGSIGVDIEENAALPRADDYRTHDFYVDHFSPREIAYCLARPDPRASFCGIWAAKEAIVKAGLARAPLEGLHALEIERDRFDRPIFPGCRLSISHTKTIAIASCVVFPLAPPPPPAHPSPPVVAKPFTVGGPRLLSKPIAIGSLFLLVGFGLGYAFRF